MTYDLATADITIPEVICLWKLVQGPVESPNDENDDGDDLRSDDLRQLCLSSLPQQC